MGVHYYTEHGFRLIIRADRADEAREWYEEQTYEDPEKLIVSPVADDSEWSRIGFVDPFSTGFWDLDAPSDLDILKRFMEEFAHASSYVNLYDADAEKLCRLQFEGKDVTQRVEEAEDAFDKVFGTAPELALGNERKAAANRQFVLPTDTSFSYDATLEGLWDELEDVTLEETATGALELASGWHAFPVGEAIEEVWRWFDEHHSQGLAGLLPEGRLGERDSAFAANKKALADIGFTGELFHVKMRGYERDEYDNEDLMWVRGDEVFLHRWRALAKAEELEGSSEVENLFAEGASVIVLEVEAVPYEDGQKDGPTRRCLVVDMYDDGTVDRETEEDFNICPAVEEGR